MTLSQVADLWREPYPSSSLERGHGAERPVAMVRLCGANSTAFLDEGHVADKAAITEARMSERPAFSGLWGQLGYGVDARW